MPYADPEKEKAYQKAYREAHRDSSAVKAARNRYSASPKGVANSKRYSESPGCKAAIKRRNASPKAKAARKRYVESPEGKAALKAGQNAYRLRSPHKVAARNAVDNEVRHGRLPPAKELPCYCCHTSPADGYHHDSYEPEHHLDVIAVCTPCHKFIHSTKITYEKPAEE